MLAKHVGALVLIIAVLLQVILLVAVPSPAYRLGLGLLLLVPIILASSSAEVTRTLWHWLRINYKLRRYPTLRSKVSAFVAEVRRLNWLVVDAEHGFAEGDAAGSDIEACKKRMQVLFDEIQEAAGKPSIGLEDEGQPEPASQGAMEGEADPAS